MTFDEWYRTQPSRFIAANLKEDMRDVWDVATKAEREACAKELDAEAARLDALGVYGDDAEYVAKLATAMRSNVQGQGDGQA